MLIDKNKISRFITVRTQFEGFHKYLGAGDIDSRIRFLETTHRHMFKVELSISVTHSDRELEFFLVKWALEEFIKKKGSAMNYKSCEMIGEDILEFAIEKYGEDRLYEIVVSEDGESDGVILYDGRE